MNILHLLPALESGGVETGTIDLALSLKRLGHTVIVVSNGGQLVKSLEDNKISHIKLPVHKKSPSAILLIPKIVSILRSHNIDIVHAKSRVPAWIGYLSCKISGTPFVTSCHGFYSKHFFSSVMGRGQRVMVISRSIEMRMIEDFKVPASRIRLVYRGVDLSKYPYQPDKYESEKISFIVINIGRLTPLKGQHKFIKAMKRVAEEIRSVEAWIVGAPERGKEHYVERLHRAVLELGMEGSIKFLGLRKDIPELLKKSDCLVLSTNVPEGFGRTVVEAGAIGTAVCASDVGGLREIITDGVSGILFPPDDEVKMAEAIIRMLSSRDFSKGCSENLRRRVENDFTLERMTKETLSVYEEVVKARVPA
ncbi:MAG: glycosyltransferase family 4 protein [Candidatus Omnitrophota bacterium]